MDHLYKIIIGLILFVVSSIIAYLFKMRQLYVASPKLYRHAPVSSSGSLCEIIVYNKGNQSEENIKVNFDPDLKIELLASNSNDITLDGFTLNVDRLHKGCEVSVMLLIEKGTFDSSKITSISSKATNGKVCKKVEDVPDNYAHIFLLIVFLIAIIPSFIGSIHLYEKIKLSYIEKKLELLHNIGWSNLERYNDSDLIKDYKNQEFPIRLEGREKQKNGDSLLKFSIYNKTALPMKVSVDLYGSKQFNLDYYKNIEVSPMSKDWFVIKEPSPTLNNNNPKLQFSIITNNDYIFNIIYSPKVDD